MENKLPKNYYTTIETAKLLGVSVRTIQLWVENGSLEAWKTAGGHRRITIDSVQRHLDSQVSENKAPDKQYSEAIVTSINKKRILIVEDNPTVAKFYQAAINSWSQSIEVVVKNDGFEGLLDIGKNPPDLLISDIYMPGMDGLQMIRSLYKSQQLSSDQIIVISGLSNDSISERGGVPSEVVYFKKPVMVDQLKNIIYAKLQLGI